MTDNLTAEFGIPGAIEFFKGIGGFVHVKLSSEMDHFVTVCLYGGMVISWQDETGADVLFVSSKAQHAPGKAIRGGIPVVFPQFGGGALPSHGFARTSNWEVVGSGKELSGEVYVEIELRDSEATRKLWPHSFVYRQNIALGESLTIGAEVRNLGKEPFSFQQALHTYFAVDSIDHTEVEGLEGVHFLDHLKAKASGVEARKVITFSEEIDRAYTNSPDLISLHDRGAGRTISITKEGMKDSVVWNPWIERGKAIADLGDLDYQSFVCVESGNVAVPLILAPGSSVAFSQEIEVAQE
jgi:glucose-6-phosphate 1-epimerase